MGNIGLPDITNAYTVQVYEGYMFKTAQRNSTTGFDDCHVNFAGTFLTPGGEGGSPQMNTFGWTAKSPIPCD